MAVREIYIELKPQMYTRGKSIRMLRIKLLQIIRTNYMCIYEVLFASKLVPGLKKITISPQFTLPDTNSEDK